ncbi:MAG: hypothetical protein R3E88_15860 [Myxococcota bacterium]
MPGIAAVARGAGAALATLLVVAYPLVVWFAWTRLDVRATGALLLGLVAATAALRARGAPGELAALARQYAPLVALVGLAVATGERVVLLWMPVVVNLFLFATFAHSLFVGMPVIERFARTVDGDLPGFCVPYCRKVTIVWCAFLLANALVAAVLAVAGPIEWWTLYTGAVGYVLMGLLFAGEFVVRKLWFRHYKGGPLDATFARLFPAERTANGRRSLAWVAAREARAAERAR